MLYCPETVVSLVRVLQRLSACLKDQQAPDAYIAFTVRSPETCWLFTSELGEPWAREGLLSLRGYLGPTQDSREAEISNAKEWGPETNQNTRRAGSSTHYPTLGWSVEEAGPGSCALKGKRQFMQQS